MSQRRGLLIILSSPSGAGKSTLSARLRAWDPTLSFSVSATTRRPRTGEVDGREYHFMTEEAFKREVGQLRLAFGAAQPETAATQHDHRRGYAGRDAVLQETPPCQGEAVYGCFTHPPTTMLTSLPGTTMTLRTVLPSM